MVKRPRKEITMKKLESISYWITMGSAIELMAVMILLTVFKIGIIMWRFDPILLTIGTTVMIFSFIQLFMAVYISTAINKVIKERRKEKELKKAA